MGIVWKVNFKSSIGIRQTNLSNNRYLKRQHRSLVCCSSVPPPPDPPPYDPSQEIVVGIDLGTTNSAIAILETNNSDNKKDSQYNPRCVQNALGFNTTPTVIGIQESGMPIVGIIAKRQAVTNPLNTYFSAKRFIGKKYEDVRGDGKRLPFKVQSDSEGRVYFQCSHIDEKVLYPEEVQAYVLAQMIADVEEQTSKKVKRAIISVPAYFDEEQQETTMAAGRLAGLQSIKLIKEPVAAALAYGLDLQQDQTVLVVDLGGGTYDISILEVGGGVIEVLATSGDGHLGGDDWDSCIIEWLIQSHLKPAGVTNLNDSRLLSNLKAMAESAKIKLSTSDKVQLRIPIAGGIEAELTQKQLDKLAVKLYRRARLPLDQACWSAGVDLGTTMEQYQVDMARNKQKRKSKQMFDDGPEIRPKRRQPISQVLLVGGATRMKGFQRFVQNMTGLCPKEYVVDPDEAVALGAAIYANVLVGEVKGFMVMDVWQANLMRALATRKLKDDPKLAAMYAEKDQDMQQNKN